MIPLDSVGLHIRRLQQLIEDLRSKLAFVTADRDTLRREIEALTGRDDLEPDSDATLGLRRGVQG